MKLWEYFKAEEEDKHIQRKQLGSQNNWLNIDLRQFHVLEIRGLINNKRLRIKPEPLRLTVMVKTEPLVKAGVNVRIKENDPNLNWDGWTKATIGEDGKLVIEVDDENI